MIPLWGIDLNRVVKRLLASLLLRRPTVTRETLTREQKIGFRRGAFDSVDGSVSLDTLAHQGMPRKSVNTISYLFAQTSGLVKRDQIVFDENLVELENADDIVLVFEEDKKSLASLDELTKAFCIHFAPTKCKVMLVDMQSLNTPITI
ncbi:hypothetical protein CLF_103439 [Clonorchis sinensis]|uniref:Reverse transcriptase domain-containing protein n=1 Tax=Clonorchis sinensis TaxID=79923 RepID=G7Y9R1_CLOSI|nr:hypothetical protein CLF_103439 [Clonorchis sinensis]